MAKAQQNYMKSSSLTEILTQFPRILSIGMIEQEFTIMYPEKTSKALARGVWCLFEILEHQRAWMDCCWVDKDDLGKLTKDEQVNTALQLLPLIMKGRSKGGKGRCGYAASLASFTDQKSENCNIDTFECN
ncbi:uncharacterized protein [Amphiura filiformis]|uniref:uncharacterized protein n=1 Tax=Amphiura filiformis TaxID=82378 RepID=UPI003B21F49C